MSQAWDSLLREEPTILKSLPLALVHPPPRCLSPAPHESSRRFENIPHLPLAPSRRVGPQTGGSGTPRSQWETHCVGGLCPAWHHPTKYVLNDMTCNIPFNSFITESMLKGPAVIQSVDIIIRHLWKIP